MPYVFTSPDSAQLLAEARRVAEELIDHSITYLTTFPDPHKAIHETRKSCKRMRALLRLFRDTLGTSTYRTADAYYRDLSRTLSPLRDAAARLECLEKLQHHTDKTMSKTLAQKIRKKLTNELEEAGHQSISVNQLHVQAGQQLMLRRKEMILWTTIEVEGPPSFDLMAKGMRRVYKSAFRAFHHVYSSPSIEAFHEWRKQVKYLRYQMELITQAWPEMLTVQATSFALLGEYLGDHHDLAVLEEVFVTNDSPLTALQQTKLKSLIAQRHSELEQDSYNLGMRLFTERPAIFCRRIAGVWGSWEEEESSSSSSSSSSSKNA